MTKLTLEGSDGGSDWYTIERAEHAHQGDFERTAPNTLAYRWSGRISDADVEGTAAEMLDIAAAIKARKSDEPGRRCAVVVEARRVGFFSPRNSTDVGWVSYADALELAEQIERELGPSPLSPRDTEEGSR
jgi:hypothetical protein